VTQVVVIKQILNYSETSEPTNSMEQSP